MKQIVKIGICITILLVLSGCWSIRTNTKAPVFPDNAVSKLNVKQPVGLINSSSRSGEIAIGKMTGVTVYGDLYKFTESSISALMKIFEKQNIEIDNSASKTLALSVYDAKSEMGEGYFIITTALRVRTGDDLEKEYVGMQKYSYHFGTSTAVEHSLAECLKQMLSDKDLIHYLEN
ncbi:MAG: hypothetical protein KKC46_19050 [Proteobacteria bacterium]|nr:hypothetical protein [Pseudomonadota bacterium]